MMAMDTKIDQPKWYRRPGRLILLGVVLSPFLFIGYGFLEIWIETNRPTYYEFGRDFPLDDLPASAKDVRFSPHQPFCAEGRTYEFKCTEMDYREWARKARLKHPELSEVRVEESEFLRSNRLPTVSKDGVVSEEIVGDYLISDWRYTDQGLYFAYDLKGGRAVKWSHSR
jgi:endogenous inhibitor of DNA gyrase (YacG/DUF329 family)